MEVPRAYLVVDGDVAGRANWHCCFDLLSFDDGCSCAKKVREAEMETSLMLPLPISGAVHVAAVAAAVPFVAPKANDGPNVA